VGKRLTEFTLLLAAAAGLALLMRGCPGPARPLDPASVSRVGKGMSEQEVFDLLGPPSDALDLSAVTEALRFDGSGFRWRDGDRKVEVYFLDGRVAGTVVKGY